MKIKKGDQVLYYDTMAEVLVEPDEFGQLQIGTESAELWVFAEEIRPISDADMEEMSTAGPVLE